MFAHRACICLRFYLLDHPSYGNRSSVVPGGNFNPAFAIGCMNDLSLPDIHGKVIDFPAAGIK